MKSFNGDFTRWTAFWDTFESAVHNNAALMSNDKFNYLNSLLESVTTEAMSGLTLSAAHYEKAIAILKRRFRSKQMIINYHIELLLKDANTTLKGSDSSMIHWIPMSEA